MRIGTWNLEGKWSPLHREVLTRHDCDVWLLTEVQDRTRLGGYASVTTAAEMSPGRAWAAVLSRHAMAALPDPHPASAAAHVAEVIFCSSVLPWRGSGGLAPWCGPDQAGRTRACVEQLMESLPQQPLVWGGDFNHALVGSEVAGCAEGGISITAAVETRGMTVPTIGQPHRRADVLTIDHVAVPQAWETRVEHHPVDARLSDHDVYVVHVNGL